MKVYYSDVEQPYHPRRSFFCGRFTAYPDVPGRTRSILAALEGHPAAFQPERPAPVEPALLERVHGRGYLEALAAVCARLKPEEEFFPFHQQRLPLL
ncbi:MAG: hypothetical protein GWO16_14750, partial [Gammaproteobacteria bacterium]|nr:hypothetical protein [Gammaproteobacteria bacterium]